MLNTKLVLLQMKIDWFQQFQNNTCIADISDRNLYAKFYSIDLDFKTLVAYSGLFMAWLALNRMVGPGFEPFLCTSA